MILHICIDSLFNDLIIEQFEKVAPNENKYITLSEDKITKFEFSDQVDIISKKQFLDIYNEFSIVWIHCLSDENLWACSLLVDHIVMWSSWGGDQKGRHDFLQEKNTYEPFTIKHIYTGKDRFKLYIKQFSLIQKIYSGLNTSPINNLELLKESYKNINFMSTVLLSEQRNIENLPELNSQYQWFNYVHLKMIVKRYYNEEVKLEKGIVVGNSASSTQNHIDTFYRIKAERINRKVFCPVSYGNEKYRKLITTKANELLENVEFQTSNLSLDDYLDKFAEHHVLILNCKIQQALGNLLTGVYIGMKVFLNKKGLLYEFCKEVGLVVYALEELNKKEVEDFLPQNIIHFNRNKLEEVFGEEVVFNRTKGIINLLNKSVINKNRD